jgi:hypothetical protein
MPAGKAIERNRWYPFKRKTLPSIQRRIRTTAGLRKSLSSPPEKRRLCEDIWRSGKEQ